MAGDLTLRVRHVAVDQGFNIPNASIQASVQLVREPPLILESELLPVKFMTPPPPSVKMLRCSTCLHWKVDEEFPRNKTRASRRGREYNCKKCVRRYQKNRRGANTTA